MNLFILLILPACKLLSLGLSIGELPWVNGHDRKAALYAAPYLPRNPVILEAGVCKGYDTCRLKEIWKNAVIHGFEPLPTSYQTACKTTQDLVDVYLYPFALSDKVGTSTFYASRKNAACSSLLEDNFANVDWPFNKEKKKRLQISKPYKDAPIIANTTTIDVWSEEYRIQGIDYIWLDTEGAELQILSSAQRVLPKVKVISTEVNFQEFRKGMTQFWDLYEFMKVHGFSLKYIWGHGKWQGVAMFLNDRYHEFYPGHVEEYIVPEPCEVKVD